MHEAQDMDRIIRELEDALEVSEMRRQHKGRLDLTHEKQRLRDLREKRSIKMMSTKSNFELKKESHTERERQTQSMPDLLQHDVKTKLVDATADAAVARRAARGAAHRFARQRQIYRHDDTDAAELLLDDVMTTITSQRDGPFASRRSSSFGTRDSCDAGTQTGCRATSFGSDVVLTPRQYRKIAEVGNQDETPMDTAVVALLQQARELAAQKLQSARTLQRMSSRQQQRPSTWKRGERALEVLARDCYALKEKCEAGPVLQGRRGSSQRDRRRPRSAPPRHREEQRLEGRGDAASPFKQRHKSARRTLLSTDPDVGLSAQVGDRIEGGDADPSHHHRPQRRQRPLSRQRKAPRDLRVNRGEKEWQLGDIAFFDLPEIWQTASSRALGKTQIRVRILDMCGDVVAVQAIKGAFELHKRFPSERFVVPRSHLMRRQIVGYHQLDNTPTDGRENAAKSSSYIQAVRRRAVVALQRQGRRYLLAKEEARAATCLQARRRGIAARRKRGESMLSDAQCRMRDTEKNLLRTTESEQIEKHNIGAHIRKEDAEQMAVLERDRLGGSIKQDLDAVTAAKAALSAQIRLHDMDKAKFSKEYQQLELEKSQLAEQKEAMHEKIEQQLAGKWILRLKMMEEEVRIEREKRREAQRALNQVKTTFGPGHGPEKSEPVFSESSTMDEGRQPARKRRVKFADEEIFTEWPDEDPT